MTVARGAALAAAIVGLVAPPGAASASPDGGKNGYTQVVVTPEGLSAGLPTRFDGQFYFSGSEQGPDTSGPELWRGTLDPKGENTAEQVADINPDGGSAPTGLTPAGDDLYFGANDGTSGDELWRYDSTTDDTVRITDLDDGVVLDPTTEPDPPEPDGSSSPDDLTPVGDTLYFSADHGDPTHDRNLYSITADSEVPEMVGSDIDGPRNPRDLVLVGDDLYYSADNPDPLSGGPFRLLWRTDTTTGASQPVAEVNPEHLVRLGRSLYFSDETREHGAELWRYRTGSGRAAMVRDIGPGRSGGLPRNLTPAHGVLFFSADDDVHGRELWRTDPASGRTRMVTDIDPGSDTSDPLWLTPAGRYLYVNADDGRTGAELWRTRVAGGPAQQVADLNPGRERSFPTSVSAVDGVVYLEADGRRGTRVWASDVRSGKTVVALGARQDIGLGVVDLLGEAYFVPLFGGGIHRIDPPPRG